MAIDYSIQQGKFFIVGCTRSGTTLLHQLVASHSQVVGVYETYCLKKFNPRKPVEENIRKVSRNNKEYQMVLSYFKKVLGDTFNKEMDPYQFLDTYCEAHRTNFRCFSYVEKSPPHSFFVEGLLSKIPNSKIIAILRDPRAVIASRLFGNRASRPYGYKVPRKLHFYLDFSEVLFTYKALNKWYLSPNRRLLFVKYEDLVKDPEEIIRKIFTFLELPREPVYNNINPLDMRMEALHIAGVMNSSYGKKKGFTISKSSLKKWIGVLTSSEIRFIENCISQMEWRLIRDFYPSLIQTNKSKFKPFLMKIFSELDYHFFLIKNIKSLDLRK